MACRIPTAAEALCSTAVKAAPTRTEDRVGEGRQQGEEALALPQRLHRAAHALHAEHQHRKAQQDIPHVVVALLLGKHAQENPDHRHQRGQRRGGQERYPATRPLNAAQGDDPARDAGADQGAVNDADRLPQLHHAGVDKTDHHHRGGRRGLDHSGDSRAKQHTLQRCARQAIEYQLHLTAGHPFQSVAHQAHAEQKQGHTAQQTDHISKAQNLPSRKAE